VYEIRDEKVSSLGTKIKEIMESILPAKETREVPIVAVVKSGPDWGSMHLS